MTTLWIIGLVGLGLILHGCTDWFSTDARIGRKRRRSYRRVSGGRFPSVIFSVNTRRS